MKRYDPTISEGLVDTQPNFGRRSVGPLAALDGNKWAVEEKLSFPLDISDASKYPHYIRFNINIPERSKYTKSGNFSQTGAAGLADIAGERGGGAIGDTGSSDPFNLTAGLAGLAGAAPGLATVVGAFVGGKSGYSSQKGALWSAASNALKAGGAGLAIATAFAFVDLQRKTRRLAQSICLYIPETLHNGTSFQYDATSITEVLAGMGFAAQAGADITSTNYEGMGASRGSNGTAGGGTARDGSPITGEAIGRAATVAGMDSRISNVLVASAGYAINPQIEILFKKSVNREFKFLFNFMPKSQQEAIEVLKIIKAFRFHSAPELLDGSSGRYFVPPSEFDISFFYNGKENKALFKTTSCVLTNVDVDYVGGLEQFTSHDDGIPVSIAMQLEFQEVEVMHKKMVEEGF